MGSKRFEFDLSDAIGLGKNALLVGAGAALTYFGANIGDIDFGNWGPLVVAVVVPLIDAGIKLIKDNTKV